MSTVLIQVTVLGIHGLPPNSQTQVSSWTRIPWLKGRQVLFEKESCNAVTGVHSDPASSLLRRDLRSLPGDWTMGKEKLSAFLGAVRYWTWTDDKPWKSKVSSWHSGQSESLWRSRDKWSFGPTFFSKWIQQDCEASFLFLYFFLQSQKSENS